jgi:hypothetical protein
VNRTLAVLAAALVPLVAHAQGIPPVTGIIWQLYESAPDAKGSWQRLGVRELLIQWTAVDGIAYVPGTKLRPSARMPDWKRIAAEPWAERVIVGLSGRTDEQTTRRSLESMLTESLAITKLELPFRPAAWYFPAEVDPTWKYAPLVLPPVLARLPRPLWISAYDGESMGADEFADWLASWMPPDVGVFFQDGVGVHVRSARVARQYADALVARLGKERVAIIAEAFREQDKKFRPATAAELKAQLPAYRGYRIFLFDGPHYVPDAVVDVLAAP